MADIRITVPVSNYALEPIVPKATWTTLTNRQYQVRRGGEGMALVLQRVNAGGETFDSSTWGVLAAQFAALELPGNFAIVNFAQVCGYTRKGRFDYVTASALVPGQTRVRVPNIFNNFGLAGSIRVGDIIEIAGEIKLVIKGVEGNATDPSHDEFLQFMPGMRKAAPVGTPIECDFPEGRFEVRDQPPSASVNDQDAGLLNVGQLQVSLFEADQTVLARAPAAIGAAEGEEPLPEVVAEEEEEAVVETESPGGSIFPTARAGGGRTFIKPQYGVLDGSNSRQLDALGALDRDARLNYRWVSLSTPSGQAAPTIDRRDRARTGFRTVGLRNGAYSFQLTVTNSDGLSSTGTVNHRVGTALAALAATSRFAAKADGITRTTVTLEWESVLDAGGWQIRGRQTGTDWWVWRNLEERFRQYTFANLTAATAYEFQIRPTRQGVDNTAPALTASATATTAAAAAPTPSVVLPTSVPDAVISNTGYSAVIEWSAPAGHDASPPTRATRYEWQLYRVGPTGEEPIGKLEGHGATAKTSALAEEESYLTTGLRANLRTLRPQTSYLLRVWAVYGTRKSDPVTIPFTTGNYRKALPPGPVRNLTAAVADIYSDAVRFTWDAPTPVDGRALPQKYFWSVRHSRVAGSAGLAVHSPPGDSSDTEGYASGLEPDTEYRIVVAAADALDTRGAFVNVLFRTREAGMPAPVRPTGTDPEPIQPMSIPQPPPPSPPRQPIVLPSAGPLRVQVSGDGRLYERSTSPVIPQRWAGRVAVGIQPGSPPYQVTWTLTVPGQQTIILSPGVKRSDQPANTHTRGIDLRFDWAQEVNVWGPTSGFTLTANVTDFAGQTASGTFMPPRQQ